MSSISNRSARYRSSRRAYTSARSRTATTSNQSTVKATIFESKNIVFIVRAVMNRLKKSPSDRMFYINAYRLVSYLGTYLMRMPYGRDYRLYLHSATLGLTTDKSPEDVARVGAELERQGARIVKYLTVRLNVPYLKDFEEAVTIQTAIAYVLAALKHAHKLETAEDAKQEELIEEEYDVIEESLELDYFTFPQFVYFLTKGLQIIGQDPEERTNYYLFAATFVEQVEDAIIKSWFGTHYLTKDTDEDGNSFYKLRGQYKTSVPSNPDWAQSLNRRLTYLKSRLASTLAPHVNAFFLTEDQETLILNMIVNDVVESLKQGVDLKGYDGDLNKHEDYLTDVSLEAGQANAAEKVADAKSKLSNAVKALAAIDHMLSQSKEELQRKKRLLKDYVKELEKFINKVDPK